MITIPQNKRWVQTNTGNILGSLWSTFNMDFTSNQGVARVSPRMLLTTNGVTNSNFNGIPVGFKLANGYVYTLAGNWVWRATPVPGTTFTQDTAVGTPNSGAQSRSDIEVFNNLVHVTGNTTVTRLDSVGTTWTAVTSALTTGTPHMMCQYGNLLYVTDNYSKIGKITTGGVYTANVLDLSAFTSNYITFIRASSNRIWIGTVNFFGTQAAIYEWDGAATQVTRSYTIESRGAVACVIKDNIPYVIDSDGKLLGFTGGGFKEIARLPTQGKYLKNAAYPYSNIRFIHPNGMTVDNGRINFLISNEVNRDGSIVENCPSGIWEFDENNGLYHKYSLSSYDLTSGSISDYGHNRIAYAGALSALRYDLNESVNGRLICGAIYYTDAVTSVVGAFVDETSDTIQKSGYIVTQKAEGSGLEDTWQKVYLKYRKLLSSSDKITVKYRVEEIEPVEVSITWTSTSTFTTATSLVGKEGYEVEITQGTGGGKTAHISRVDWDGSLSTITLDDTFIGATGTAKARVQNWIKKGEIANQRTQFDEVPLGVPNTWIQLKVCMIFTGKDELSEILIINTKNK